MAGKLASTADRYSHQKALVSVLEHPGRFWSNPPCICQGNVQNFPSPFVVIVALNSPGTAGCCHSDINGWEAWTRVHIPAPWEGEEGWGRDSLSRPKTLSSSAVPLRSEQLVPAQGLD